jgi:hypothetical protein
MNTTKSLIDPTDHELKLMNAWDLCEKHSEDLSETAFFKKLGRGQEADAEFGGWEGLPAPAYRSEFLAQAGLRLARTQRGRKVKLGLRPAWMFERIR